MDVWREIMKSKNNFDDNLVSISSSRTQLDNNPCGICRANGMPICKGHGTGSSGESSEVNDDRTSRKDLSATSDKSSLKSIFTSLKKSQLWVSDYEEMIFNYINPDSLILITANTGSGLINISGIPIKSESQEKAQNELLNAIEQELNQFLEESEHEVSVKIHRTGKRLEIKIPDKTCYDAFMQRLMDKNLLITRSAHVTHEITPPKKIQTAIKRSMSSLEELQEKNHLPGIAVAIISNQGKVTTQSVGVTNSTLFEAASLSKPVFAYIVLKLAQDGKINLDTPLYKYGHFGPPEIRIHENYNKLTARMILSHQAALPNESSLPEFIPEVNVGEKFNYSGVAYQFLGEVVQNITKQSLETLAQKAFAKIGMTNSSFMPPTGCSLIKLPDYELKPIPESLNALLQGTLDRHGQLSIIYHQDRLFIAEKADDGQIQLIEKDPSQIEENNLIAIKKRFADIPNNAFWLSKPISVEARELPLIIAIVGHPPKYAATIAIGHNPDNSVDLKQKFYIAHPGASLYTTAEDYGKFLRECTTDEFIRTEMFGVKISGEKNNKTCTPIVPSLAGKDTKAKDNLVSPDILMQIAWGVGIGLQRNPNGSFIAFHWGDNGSGRNLAAINLTTKMAVVCLTNSANGPLAFRSIAEPVVGDLTAVSQWLSRREGLPMAQGIRTNLTQEMRLYLHEQKQISTTTVSSNENKCW
ncbi:class C beta-lactamase-related serine hydrolase [Legionella sainthelensi]|uniref:Beta-lactamase-related domain-containing protein n=2 Tax=Legionella sainthelensi TaxID=28087 RepID=A0A2H5FMG4_9GAMM|nr:class C beta-lactamase-related serine hydrolase [Legionella sainthelensi]